MTNQAASIVVVGSINMDLVVQQARLPQAGETVLGQNFQMIPGGKGANQAVAAARLGAEVSLVARLGDDDFAPLLKKQLEHYGVQTHSVQSTTGHSSGVALIHIEESGENNITVVSGANSQLSPDDVKENEALLAKAKAVVVQLETPVEAVLTALQLAKKHQVFTVLDPAPMPDSDLPDELLQVDLISPNQSEAEALTGLKVGTPDQALEAASILRDQGAKTVVMKLGPQGALILNDDGSEHIPAFSVEVKDTTAAGDAFTAALALGLSEGLELSKATVLACAAGGLATTRLGAQPAMPSREEVNRLL